MDNKRGAPPLCLVIVSGFLPRYAMQEAEAAGWLAGGPPDLSQILIRLCQKPSKEQLKADSSKALLEQALQTDCCLCD